MGAESKSRILSVDPLGTDIHRAASDTRKSSQNITALLPPRVRARIEEAAAWQGVSAASFLVAAAAQAADEVIERERRFRLTREDADLVAARAGDC